MSARGGRQQTIRVVIEQAPANTLTAMPVVNENGQLVKQRPVRVARF